MAIDTLQTAIVSTLVQRAFGQSLGFGDVKVGGDNTTNHSLCLEMLKLAALSHNSVLMYGHSILTFQVNGYQLVFHMTQMIHNHCFTMTEVGRITLPEALSCLHLFFTLKNIRTFHLSARPPSKFHTQSTPQPFLPLQVPVPHNNSR